MRFKRKNNKKEEKIMYCKNCGKEIAEGTSFCGHCGTNVQSTGVKEDSKWWFLLGFAIPLVGGTMYFMDGNTRKRGKYTGLGAIISVLCYFAMMD